MPSRRSLSRHQVVRSIGAGPNDVRGGMADFIIIINMIVVPV
jgi:hypothetical protein